MNPMSQYNGVRVTIQRVAQEGDLSSSTIPQVLAGNISFCVSPPGSISNLSNFNNHRKPSQQPLQNLAGF
jgi:hypothetical protein